MSRVARFAVKSAIVAAVAAAATLLHAPTAAAMTFNDGAPLDTSTIDDWRTLEPAGTLTVVPARTVPAAGGTCNEPLPVPPASTPTPTPQSRPLVNLNTATYAQIMALPHIDKVLTDRIVTQRALRPFTSLDDMRHRVARFPSAVAPLVTV